MTPPASLASAEPTASAFRLPSPPVRLAGGGLILLGVGLNIPFALLGAMFEYPDILRQPTADVLRRFQGGGAPLIWTWYAFTLAALLLIPVSILVHDALAPADGRRASSALRLATVAGVGAGLVQTLGLIRWVFAVPGLAATFCDPASSEAARAAAVVAFESLHHYAGVALGEHLGQLGTALWAAGVTWELSVQRSSLGWLGWLGLLSSALIAVGLAEGFATVIPFSPGVIGVATPVGYVGLSVWMVALGISLLRRSAAARG